MSGASPPPGPSGGRTPGWYPAPGDINTQRYWDGSAWTGQRRWDGGTWVETAPPTGGGPSPGPGHHDPARPGPPTAGRAAPASGDARGGGGGGSRRTALVVLVGLIVVAAAAAVIVASTTTSSHHSTASAGSSTTTTAAASGTTTSALPPSQAPSAALVAACQADAQGVVAAVTAYQARNGADPAPPSPWSAASYDADYAPLTSSSNGGPYLPRAPGTAQYVIEYDSGGHVWIAPPGSYEPTYNVGQSFDGNPNICLAAVR